LSDKPGDIGKLLQQMADDFPGNPIVAALMSPTPPAARRVSRPTVPAPPRVMPGGSQTSRPTWRISVSQPPPEGNASSEDNQSIPAGSYEILRAYAVTLAPGRDGTARIDPEAALQFARASNWSHKTARADKQRPLIMIALAHMARKGDLDKRKGVASYHTWPPGHKGGPGVDPVLAGKGS
jgi:hypothetical protein